MAGGLEGYNKIIKSCERYDILLDTWSIIPDLPYACYNLSLSVIDKRYIIGIGHSEDKNRK